MKRRICVALANLLLTGYIQMTFAVEAPTAESCKAVAASKTNYCEKADQVSDTDPDSRRYRTGCILFSLRERDCVFFYSGKFDTNFKNTDGEDNCDTLKSYYDYKCKVQTFHGKAYRPKECPQLNAAVQACINLRNAENNQEQIEATIQQQQQQKAKLEQEKAKLEQEKAKLQHYNERLQR